MKNQKIKIKIKSIFNLNIAHFLLSIVYLTLAISASAVVTWNPDAFSQNMYGDEAALAHSNNYNALENVLDVSNPTALLINGTKIKAGTVPLAALAGNSVNSSKVVDNSLTASDLAPGSVGNSELGALAVTAAKIGNAAVETAKIKDLNITAGKLAAAVQSDIDEWESGGTMSGALKIFTSTADKLTLTPYSDTRVYVKNQMNTSGAGAYWYYDIMFGDDGGDEDAIAMRWWIDGYNEMSLYNSYLDVKDNKIINLVNGTGPFDAVNKLQLDSKLSSLGGTMGGDLEFSGSYTIRPEGSPGSGHDLTIEGGGSPSYDAGNLILSGGNSGNGTAGNVVLKSGINTVNSTYDGNIVIDAKQGDCVIASSQMNSPTSVVDKAYVDTANNNVLDDAKNYADSVAIDLTTVSNQFLLRTGDYVGGTMTFSNDINLAASGVTTIRNTYPGFSGITIISGSNPSPGNLKLKTDNIPYTDAGDIEITAGNSTDTLGNGDGGSISLTAGSANGSGTAGDIYIVASNMNSPTSVVDKAYVDTATNECADLYVHKSGDTMSGNLEVSGIIGNDSVQTISLSAGATTFAVTKNIVKVYALSSAVSISTITGAKPGFYAFLFSVPPSTHYPVTFVHQTGSIISDTLKLNGEVNFVSTNYDVITLMYDGTSWYQVAPASEN